MRCPACCSYDLPSVHEVKGTLPHQVLQRPAPGCLQDEDFVLHMFGIRLDMPGVRDAAGAALSELGLAEERLTAMQGQQRQQQQQANGVSRSGVASAGSREEAGIEPEHRAAFLARVRFRRALLKVSVRPTCKACQPSCTSRISAMRPLCRWKVRTCNL